jgi:hypothetical protein
MSQPAFPTFMGMGDMQAQGMTLRDYFAAKALQGLLADQAPYDEITFDISEVYARISYEYADAMLKARKQ